MSRINSVLAILVLLTLSVNRSRANDLEISNVSLGAQDMVLNNQALVFDIAWDNSWRTSTLESNNDAVWVFVKYRLEGSILWSHATLLASATSPPSGAELVLASDGMGLFVQQAAANIGNVSYAGVEVLWDRAADGVASDEIVEVCALGIEMVYAPEGSYQLGDGSLQPLGNLAAQDTTPFTISSEAGLTLGGTNASSLYSINTAPQSIVDDFTDINPVVLPAAFPKGFNAFYQMKYEIDMGLYVEMLNKLDAVQAAARFMGSNSFGNTIISDGSPTGGFSTATPDRACNFMNWADFVGLGDWAGLRPMSEMEFEKSCRGDRPALADELATGTQFATFNSYTLINSGLPNEQITNPDLSDGNFIYAFSQAASRPYRTGIFAASAVSSTRLQTGATRYGAMEMCGNIWEMSVSLGSSQGRAFTGEHGDGELDASGNANVSFWPAAGGQGGGIQGGGLFSSGDKLTVSSRIFSNLVVSSRDPDIGGRFVRSVN